MEKHKTKLIALITALAVLSAVWFLGGSPNINQPTLEAAYLVAAQTVFVPEAAAAGELEENYEPADEDEYLDELTLQYHTEEETGEQYEEENESPVFDTVPQEAIIDADLPDIKQKPDEVQIFSAYHPQMRAPVEPEDMVIGDDSFTVILSVRAHTILYNMHLLHRDKHELVPADGWIFPPTEVIAYEGESVFNVLQREMRRNGIHMAARFTPVFNSAYVEAINNIFEFDAGYLSGWMYSVNGWFPNFGASRYLLSPGDIIEWVYTVDLGRDLGVCWLGGEGQ